MLPQTSVASDSLEQTGIFAIENTDYIFNHVSTQNSLNVEVLFQLRYVYYTIESSFLKRNYSFKARARTRTYFVAFL